MAEKFIQAAAYSHGTQEIRKEKKKQTPLKVWLRLCCQCQMVFHIHSWDLLLLLKVSSAEHILGVAGPQFVFPRVTAAI